MNALQAAQARTAAPQAHPAPWFPPSFGFCMPWIMRKVHQHKLSAEGRGFPGLPTGSCSRSCEYAQHFWRLKVTARFYFLSDVENCVIEGREKSLSQSIPEEPRISTSHWHLAYERLLFHPGAALGTPAASREKHKEVPPLPVSLTTLPGAAADITEHRVEQLLT